ncbi:MAG: DUF2062 domain-containing protein [Aquimonas sp.]|nr:DUF2062 domain-containing protein [Aquimonas sp.]
MPFKPPTAEEIHASRLGKLFGPRLRDPRLWLKRRRSVALGVALGVFFGLLIPLGQFMLSGAAAILLRANLPMAMVSTLITNPVTFGPIYVAAYRTGSLMLGEDIDEEQMAEALAGAEADSGLLGWLGGVGKPLALGLLVFASAGSVLAYWGIRLTWTLAVLRRRRAQRKRFQLRERKPA